MDLKSCPFPHEVKRGVFLEIDTDDFGFARGACSDCGCAGPYVTLESCERVSEAERAEAVRLWNTRVSLIPEDRVVEAMQNLIEDCDELGKWMSAALDDPSVGSAMKTDISVWLSALDEARSALGKENRGGDDE